MRDAAKGLCDLTVYELKSVCRVKGLKVSGRKAELIARIEETVDHQAAETEAAQRGEEQGGERQRRSDAAVETASEGETSECEEQREKFELVSEVLSAEEASAAELDKWRSTRRAERRKRLAGYYSDEYAKMVANLEMAACPAYARALDSP